MSNKRFLSRALFRRWRHRCRSSPGSYRSGIRRLGRAQHDQGVTELSGKIYDLHMLVLWVCVGIAVIVFGAMIFAMVRFRKSKGAVADTSFVHSTKFEIVWTLAPVVILIIMAVPAAKAIIIIEDTRNSELTIKATAYQWKWQYDYIDSGVNFFSTLAESSNFARQKSSGIDPNTVENYLLEVDHHLVIPIDTKVRLLLTANDVIHAWWVPALGMKKDAIPGFVNEMWIKRARKPARSAGNARSCAAAITASCRSSSMS